MDNQAKSYIICMQITALQIYLNVMETKYYPSVTHKSWQQKNITKVNVSHLILMFYTLIRKIINEIHKSIGITISKWFP